MMLMKNYKKLLIFLINPALIASIFVYPALSEPIANMTGIQIPKEEGKTKMGNIYYIDATKGMDSNDGLSPERAWKTIGKANSAKLNPGDSVLLKRGEVWREQLVPQRGDEVGYITYGAYGNGDKPLLLGSVNVSKPGDWIHEGHNIWATTSPKLPVDVGNLIFNNEKSVGVKVWNQEDMDSQGKFWYDEDNRILKMYSESNPAAYYSNIECALRRHIIDEGGKSYVIYENLDLRYGGAHGIGGGNTHHIVARNCDLSYIGGGDQMGGDRTVRFGNGIEFWENAHDNLVEGCRLWEIYDAALTNQGSRNNSQINIHYRNNTIWNCEYSFEYWNRGGESTTRQIYFENNTCVNAGYGWGHNQRPDPNGRHLMFYNNTAKTFEFFVRRNIFYEATESCLRLGNDWSFGLDMDYNCWYQSQGTMIKWLSDTYTMDQFSEYQREKGQDKHSIASDPRFADVDGRDFRPVPGSPVLKYPEIGAISASIKIVTKPTDQLPEILVQTQPTIPENYKETPFIETAPPPELTAEEKERGYFLFQRPIMEPVYPNTRPLEHERLGRLVAFATPDEFEPLTFSIYPTRDLKNLKVRCSSLACNTGEIPASQITVRLVTYWNVGYPRYTSRDTYRRIPELLERVTMHTSPALECQRYLIVIHVPKDAKPGLYRGNVTVWDDEFDKAVQIPVEFRVLSFMLQRDPAKHYSAYYYVRNRTQYRSKSEQFIQKASQNEYQAMLDYGLDMVPTQYLDCPDGQAINMRNPEDLDRLVKMGFKGPVPATADGVISRIYRDTTPDGQRGSHWQISKMPSPEFYARVTELFKAFKAECIARGWPEFVCCPIDEVSSSHSEFGAKTYAAVREAGIRTYITKSPTSGDAAPYLPYVDVWCSQPYSMPYEKIIAQDRYEYWCYPNHNAGEIKDRRVMCKGGRMTYGFGLWRSGYTTLIPWHWSWTPGDDQFDYLRGPQSGCGQRITDEGEIIPVIYWECFREGNDDARYIHTLQQAIFEREDSRDPECRNAVEDAKKLLQATWDAINVQQKYLAEGMWPSEEFNARRWLLATAIERLMQYPIEKKGVAPSVLVANTVPQPAKDETPIIEKAIQAGNMETKDLSDGFTSWVSGTKEGTVQVTEEAGHQGQKGLRWHILVDHENDGGEGGNYPVGWPRISRIFNPGELDMSNYDYLSFVVRVDSDRDEVADDSTPLGFTIASHKATQRFFSTQRDLGDRQQVWIPIRFSIKDIMESVGLGIDPWSDISRLQFYISEGDFHHGTNLIFDIAEIKLLRFESPVISQIIVPEYFLLPKTWLSISYDAMGTNSVKPRSHRLTAKLTNIEGQTVAQQDQDLAGQRVVVLNTASILPGSYQLSLRVTNADGEFCSEEIREIKAIPGPNF